MEVVTTVSAALAAAAALIAVVLAQRTLDSSRTAGSDLRAAATTLREIVGELAELTTVQHASIAALRESLHEQRIAARHARLRYQLDRLGEVGAALDAFTSAVTSFGISDVHREDPQAWLVVHAMYAALNRLRESLAAARMDLPQCAALARVDLDQWARFDRNALSGTSAEAAAHEVQAAIVQLACELDARGAVSAPGIA